MTQRLLSDYHHTAALVSAVVDRSVYRLELIRGTPMQVTNESLS